MTNELKIQEAAKATMKHDFYHYEPTTGREVTVTTRLAGEFAVKLTNTDNEKSVVKVFPSNARNEAIAHAKSFVGL